MSYADFLAIAANRKFIVDEYVDNAVSAMGKDSDGRSVREIRWLEIDLHPGKSTHPKVPQRESVIIS